MRVRNDLGRALCLALALCLAVTATCVTAFAAEIPYDRVSVKLSDGSGDTLGLILSSAQQKKLIEACYPTGQEAESLAQGGRMTLTLTATVAQLPQADSKLLTAAVGDAQPLLAAELVLQRAVGDAQPETLTALSQTIELTIRLPGTLQGGSHKVAVRTDDGFGLVDDLDTVPNTLTCAVTRMGSLVLLPAATQLVATTPVVPITPAAPITPTVPTPPATPVQAPATGGPMEEYNPQVMSISAAVVPIARLPRTGGSPVLSQLLATSLLLTAAMVGGEIDYENAQQRQQEEQKAVAAYAEMYDTDSPKWMGLSDEFAI